MVIILNPAASGSILGTFNFRHFLEQVIIPSKFFQMISLECMRIIRFNDFVKSWKRNLFTNMFIYLLLNRDMNPAHFNLHHVYPFRLGWVARKLILRREPLSGNQSLSLPNQTI